MARHFYYFTTPHRWQEAHQQRFWEPEPTKLIKPARRIMGIDVAKQADLPAQASEPAIFCLLESQPSTWLKNKLIPNESAFETFIKQYFTPDDDIMVLQGEVKPSDDAYIFEQKHLSALSGNKFRLAWDKTSKIPHQYWDSRIPAPQYVQSQYNYALPAHICFSPIPTTRLKYMFTAAYFKLINSSRTRSGNNVSILPTRTNRLDFP